MSLNKKINLMNKKILFNSLFLTLPILGNCQLINVIPYPQEVIKLEGYNTLSLNVKLSSDPIFDSEVTYLANILKKEYEVSPKIVKKEADISLKLNNKIEKNEAYYLHVNDSCIIIEAKDKSGAFYAIQSLRQLIKKVDNSFIIQRCKIKDFPVLKWRAFMLDEARYFKGEQVVKQILDEMANLKMNVFHWHLTDDQGWRVEIKKYPLLTEIGGRRDSSQIEWYESCKYDGIKHEGFYTQEQIRNIVSYASERHITIVPEIEMPGHCAAAVASYPWLGTTGKIIKVPCKFGVHKEAFNVANPDVLKFIQDVINEIIILFPSKVIHIGGDEVVYDQWNSSKEIQRFIKDKGLTSSPDLQVWFTNWISIIINNKGKRMAGWNDITGKQLHNFQKENDSKIKLAPNTIIQFWKGDTDLILNTISAGYDIINSFNEMTYLNYSYQYDSLQSTYDFKPIPLNKAYNFSPIPDKIPSDKRKHIIGAGCQMWGEWIPNEESMNYMIYPRIAAYAETFWTIPEKKNYPRFKENLNTLLLKWKYTGIKFGPID